MLKSVVEALSKRVGSEHSAYYVSRLFSVAQPSFRINEIDPLKHSTDYEAKFYTLPENDKKQLFSHGGLPKSFEIQANTFNETCLMVRQSSLDIINCFKSLDYSKPAARFVLYGKKGSGKTLTLAHMLHGAYKNNFLIVHVPWVANWMYRCKESSSSETQEGYTDLNMDAAAWLLHFKTQNAHLLDKGNLITAEDHVWSKREITPKGSSLMELIDHGISRVKYASNCVVILANEIKGLSNLGVCKTLVAIDGYNAFFYPNTKLFMEKREVEHPHKITITQGFLNLTKFDWKNSIIILTVDELAIPIKDQISYLPRYLLGKAGFEHLDPFVPILVPDYSQKELLSCMDYYRERKWVRSYPGLDEEVSFLSANNPYKLMKICAGM